MPSNGNFLKKKGQMNDSNLNPNDIALISIQQSK
jgi:hypothetical protein